MGRKVLVLVPYDGEMSIFRQLAREVVDLWRPPARRNDFDDGAFVASSVACDLCGHFSLSTLTPEMLLHALVQDEGVAEALEFDDEMGVELARAAASTVERGGLADGWSARAKGALRAARDSAALRGARVSRGDLLSGLAGVTGLPHQILSRRPFDYAQFHVDHVANLGELPRTVAAAKDDETWVVSMRDTTTHKPFIINLFRERFGHTEARARHLAFTTEIRGAALVSRLPHADAKARVAAAHKLASRNDHRFELRLVRPPRSMPPDPDVMNYA